jgi:L-amino acid N-acyltransferase YncA
MPRTPTPSPPAVIRCTRAHLDAIRAILNHAIATSTAVYEYHPRSAAVMEQWFADREAAGAPILGIEREPGVLAGFATWGAFRPRPAYKYTAEHSVYVDERFRGRGLGHVLLKTLVDEAQTRGLHQLIGGVDAANEASIALHRKLGFRHCGTVREAGYKFGRWLDLQFWQLLLPTPNDPVDG